MTNCVSERCERCGEELKLRVAEWQGIMFSYNCRCDYESRIDLYRRLEEEEKRERLVALFKSACIPRRYDQCTLENFIVDGRNKRAVAAVKNYVDNLEENIERGNGLILYGPAGTGKTHLAVAILKRALELEHSGLFQNAPELMYRFNATYKTLETEDELIKALRDVKVLVIDDIGKGKFTEKVEERLYVVINSRYNEMNPTIITTNLEPRGLLEFLGEAIFDRLRETCIFVHLPGESYRKKVVQSGEGRDLQTAGASEVQRGD